MNNYIINLCKTIVIVCKLIAFSYVVALTLAIMGSDIKFNINITIFHIIVPFIAILIAPIFMKGNK